MNAALTINNELNGIEISFDRKPAAAILENLKSAGFKWHNKKALWYAKNTPERLELAKSIAGNNERDLQTAEKKSTEKTTVNKYGVKVGDVFYIEWGYEQTNTNFFQVVGLKGETSVLIKEVMPKMISEDYTCSMAADRRYEVTNEMLPVITHSVFVKDSDNGDLKRIKTWPGDGKPYFNVGDIHEAAFRYTGQTLYESWYY